MSIPTSLIFVVLVAAWLTVLVPMVSRRRETVPETEVDSGTFRVLRRASASMRRRPGFGRRRDAEDAGYGEDFDVDELGAQEPDTENLQTGNPDTDEYPTDEALDEELLDNEDEKMFADGFDEQEAYDDQPAEALSDHGFDGRSGTSSDGDEELQPVADQSRGRRGLPDDIDEARLRPVPRRPGRGGYDPDAADLAKAYRYSRRRRVTVILLLATVAFSVAALLISPALWSGAVVTGLLLVAYLGYLRRQVHIENDIQQRRLDRLRRARQIRPEYHLDRPEEPVTGNGFARRDLVASQVPPSGYRRGREIVDLEDDDPSFDDLDYYQPIAYRRASGQ